MGTLIPSLEEYEEFKQHVNVQELLSRGTNLINGPLWRYLHNPVPTSEELLAIARGEASAERVEDEEEPEHLNERSVQLKKLEHFTSGNDPYLLLHLSYEDSLLRGHKSDVSEGEQLELLDAEMTLRQVADFEDPGIDLDPLNQSILEEEPELNLMDFDDVIDNLSPERGLGSHFVQPAQTGTVTRVQPRSGSVTQVAPESGTITRVSPKRGTITHVAPRSGTVTQVAPRSGTVTHVAPQSGTVTHVAPQSGTVTHVAPQSGTVTQVAPQRGTVTQVAPRSGTVTQVAPKSGTVTHVAPQSGTVTQVAPQRGTVTQVAPRSGTVTQVAPQSGTVTHVAPQSGTVTQVAPQSGTVTHVAPQRGTATQAGPSRPRGRRGGGALIIHN